MKELDKNIVFIDAEISIDDKKILDLGAIKFDQNQFHSVNIDAFVDFVFNCDFVCGHNIINHDLKYLKKYFSKPIKAIDTLFLSALLFPKKPYHKLLKDDKIQSDELNNPLNDSIKAKELFFDEVNAFYQLNDDLQNLFCFLLYDKEEFKYFFEYLKISPKSISVEKIKELFFDKICQNADLEPLVKNYPIELSYALSLIYVEDYHSITPRWLLKNFPNVENIFRILCGKPCEKLCNYCKNKLNVNSGLKNFFGFNQFRKFDGESLQEDAARAAINNQSLLAIFPTGGGKSITFQVPAFLQGQTMRALTVVISPLQSLMKDQVDNLIEKGLTDAVTINGLLSPIEKKSAIESVENGIASLLYLSPESLRSKTIENLLLKRTIARFVIDEAHCFSSWGHDFRVDYLYIGDFIKNLQLKKQLKEPIPISCFTATAKQKVITDIKEYFNQKLQLDLQLFATSSTRKNLSYTVLYQETDEDKYNTLRLLIEQKNCPTIVYVSRTRTTLLLSEKLNNDGFKALPFNGKMDSKEKIRNQEAFIENKVQIIVATSAFGMGVDKKDVRLVVHFQISDSLENYVQEAGRAGRDQSLHGECFVLFNDKDLDKHFILLNQQKLSISEIQQVFSAVKNLCGRRQNICCSALEIARAAGWDDILKNEMETRVRTAIQALENAGYIKRLQNVPKIYASGILAKNMDEASKKIDDSNIFAQDDIQDAKRIIQRLISSRSIATAQDDESESRIDYLADALAIEKERIIKLITQMRQIKLLEDTSDMSAYINKSDTEKQSILILDRFYKLENFLVKKLNDQEQSFNLKELNEEAQNNQIAFCNIKNIKTIFYYWTIKNYIKKIDSQANEYIIFPIITSKELFDKFLKRIEICKFIINELYKISSNNTRNLEEIPVDFSIVNLLNKYNSNLGFFSKQANILDIEDALLYLNKISALTLEGGFMVLYNGMQIQKLIPKNNIKYKQDDYQDLNNYYKLKTQQIHIVGEYAKLMVTDYQMALEFVSNYFTMDYKEFIKKYFKGERLKEIQRNISPSKFNDIFDKLSNIQSKIINDDQSQIIAVAAGPGSGKTRVLVHKLASLVTMEDVKHEQLLMLTFSRAAASEFKKRLMDLISNAAHYIEIKTFHSYCFDLLGKIGSLEKAQDIVKDAAQMIRNGEVEIQRITKTVIVIDEAQDMDENSFALIEALMSRNEDMRLIAVGDDDQNIYQFRGSNSKYFESLLHLENSSFYQMVENFRSCSNIVEFANNFVKRISSRIKSLPSIAINKENGELILTKHNCNNFEQSIVNQILNKENKSDICILTSTNDQALKMLGLLNKYKIKAKLIQSNEGFEIYNLVEIRYFVKQIEKQSNTKKITSQIWNFALEKTLEKYSNSMIIDIVKNIIDDFSEINRDKYFTDLIEFLRESKLEDFISKEDNQVIISTIHKAKGKEFDSVFMFLDNYNVRGDEDYRALYVGLTRAKKNLYIHYNNDLFDNINCTNLIRQIDNTVYPEAEEIVFQINHKDLFLDYFRGKKEHFIKYKSGDEIDYKRDIYLSKQGENKINEILAKGYNVKKTIVKYVVAWKDKQDKQESAILLCEIWFNKQK